ncbi:hypothetical protein QFC21_006383 [Naganishia friedmannii]|uniref:Uncharacterized protein n=1 Tax=Naganishia friedmannii TaxID=89922 RepID=A0ACC2V4K1_9TREE|nr:hypothetical protein QFC21_006383 [Naganishia friedmannii]
MLNTLRALADHGFMEVKFGVITVERDPKEGADDGKSTMTGRRFGSMAVLSHDKKSSFWRTDDWNGSVLTPAGASELLEALTARKSVRAEDSAKALTDVPPTLDPTLSVLTFGEIPYNLSSMANFHSYMGAGSGTVIPDLPRDPAPNASLATASDSMPK